VIKWICFHLVVFTDTSLEHPQTYISSSFLTLTPKGGGMMRSLVLALVLSMALLSTAALADVPGLISYQGTLTDDGGVALDTTVAMTFSIYPDSNAGPQLWTETQPSVEVTDGLFNVLLGRVIPLSDAVFLESERWLGVQVGGDPEMTPRQRIGSVAYAFRTARADTAEYAHSGDDGDWTIAGNYIYSAVSGNVGIGTSIPIMHLHVVGDDTLGSLMIAPSQGGSGNDAELILAEDNNGTYNMRLKYDGSDNQLQVFGEFPGTMAGPHVVVTRDDGDVGIGTASPSVKLDVVGVINADSLYMIGGQPALSTPSTQNTFVGINAGMNNTGDYNTFVGYRAGYQNFTGNGNVFIGYNAGYTYAGSSKLYIANGPNDSNVLIYGDFSTGMVGLGTTNPVARLDVRGNINADSLYKIGGDQVLSVEGTGNTLVGLGVGGNISTGNWNTFIGEDAGYSNTSADYNTFLGWEAGYSNTTGSQNTFIGKGAGRSHTTGINNTFLGENTGYINDEGDDNTFIGNKAGYENQAGNENTYVGAQAGRFNEGGNRNIFIGYLAGRDETSASDRLYIESSPTASPLIWGDFSNDRVVIDGNDTDNTNNRTFFVNGSAGGNTPWYNDSDERLKKDITTIPDALRKVQKLRGVNFEWKDSENHEPGRKMGFIAQEAVAIIPEAVAGDEGHYAMQYGPITALLVEALKEQQEIIEQLQARVEALEETGR
jgi:hypothetical protein